MKCRLAAAGKENGASTSEGEGKSGEVGVAKGGVVKEGVTEVLRETFGEGFVHSTSAENDR